MLNITTRISFTKRSKRKINKFWKDKKGSLNTDSWSSIHRSVKNEVSYKLLFNQDFKCVYCERYLINLGHEIDHFAHKAVNSRFSFNPTNLFYACRACNSPARKGSYNIVMTYNNKYNDCEFCIIHPYFHNPDIEILFTDPDRVTFDWNNCSNRGKGTIVFFGFDDYTYTNIRSRQLVFERLNPLTPHDEFFLIQEAIAYR
jgi:uncharacterized protein (TIGR02646 family)